MDIQSVQNARVKEWMKLHTKKGRDEAGQFLVEGEHLIQEAIKAQCVQVLLIQENHPFSFDGCEVLICHEAVMKKLSQSVSGSSLIAVCRIPKKEIENHKRVLLLDNIQDPGNMGTILRTAHAFGFNGIYCSEDCVDIYNDKVIRSTQGALFAIELVRTDLMGVIKKLKDDGVYVVGTALDNAIEFSKCESKEKMAFVFGNEGQGIRDELLQQMNQTVKIEMNSFDSLNVAVAAGICMYHFRTDVSNR